MPYCRKCGAKLEEGARFCRVCGTPVEGEIPSRAPATRRRRTSLVIPVAILAAVLLVAFIFAVFAFVPFQQVNFQDSKSILSVSGLESANLNFEADAANVNIIPTDLPNELIMVNVSVTGSTGLFASATEPVRLTLNNQPSGNALDVNSKLSRTESWPISFNLNVTCNIYIDQHEEWNLNATTTVGKVTLNPKVPVTLQELNLRSTAGSIEADLNEVVAVARNVSITTTTGSVQFRWSNIQISRNTSVNLETTLGSVTANVTQNGDLGGSVLFDASTTTGSINLGMSLRDNVGAQITSHANLGSISTDVQNFNGNKSPIYSSNYPADRNFLVNLQTSIGSIRITASYQGSGSSAQA